MTSDDWQAASLVPCAGRPEAAGFGEIRQISQTSRGRYEDPRYSSDLIEGRPEYRSHPARLDFDSLW
jgi:hypothetical protein